MHSHDTPVNQYYTTESWTLLGDLIATLRPHDALHPPVAWFCASHLAELSRIARQADHSGDSYANLSALHRAFRTEPTGRTLLRNRIYIDRPIPDAAQRAPDR